MPFKYQKKTSGHVNPNIYSDLFCSYVSKSNQSDAFLSVSLVLYAVFWCIIR